MLAATVEAALFRWLASHDRDFFEIKDLQRKICVNQVVEAGKKYTKDPEANKDPCRGGHGPVYIRGVASPAEPMIELLFLSISYRESSLYRWYLTKKYRL